MEEENDPIGAGLKAPRAGAIAGIIFSILLIISLVLVRLAVPDSPRDPGTWLTQSVKSISLAMGLLPFAGIAFLWFMGRVARPDGSTGRPFSRHRFPGQRAPISRPNFCVIGGYRWFPDSLRSNSREADGLRHLCLCPHPGL